MESLQKQHGRLRELSHERDVDLDASLGRLEEFTDSLQRVEDAVEGLIDVMTDQRPISGDVEVIMEQQDELKVCAPHNNAKAVYV